MTNNLIEPNGFINRKILQTAFHLGNQPCPDLGEAYPLDRSEVEGDLMLLSEMTQGDQVGVLAHSIRTDKREFIPLSDIPDRLLIKPKKT